MPRIEAVFAPEDRLIAFCESFLSDDSIRDFYQFLGIAAQPANTSRRFNVSPRDREPSLEDWAAVRAAYDDTYTFCAEKYGADRIARLWQNMTLELSGLSAWFPRPPLPPSRPRPR